MVQPYQITRQNNQNKVVAYSLGNFLANQLRGYTYLGAIMKMDLIRDRHGRKNIVAIEAIPTKNVKTMVDRRRTYRIIPLEPVPPLEEEMILPRYMAKVMKNEAVELKRHLCSMPARELGPSITILCQAKTAGVAHGVGKIDAGDIEWKLSVNDTIKENLFDIASRE